MAVAAIFYGQARADEDDIRKLSKALGLYESVLQAELGECPFRGGTVEMPRMYSL